MHGRTGPRAQKQTPQTRDPGNETVRNSICNFSTPCSVIQSCVSETHMASLLQDTTLLCLWAAGFGTCSKACVQDTCLQKRTFVLAEMRKHSVDLKHQTPCQQAPGDSIVCVPLRIMNSKKDMKVLTGSSAECGRCTFVTMFLQ